MKTILIALIVLTASSCSRFTKEVSEAKPAQESQQVSITKPILKIVPISQTHDILPGKITSIDVANVAALGKNVEIIVNFNGGTNGCARPDHLEVVQNNFNISIRSFYNYPKADTLPCLMVIPRHVIQHSFIPERKGIYHIKAFDDDEINAKFIIK